MEAADLGQIGLDRGRGFSLSLQIKRICSQVLVAEIRQPLQLVFVCEKAAEALYGLAVPFFVV